jgi:hypothetical protein
MTGHGGERRVMKARLPIEFAWHRGSDETYYASIAPRDAQSVKVLGNKKMFLISRTFKVYLAEKIAQGRKAS